MPAGARQRRYLLHRHQRVAALQREADGRHQGAEAMPGGDPAHLLDDAVRSSRARGASGPPPRRARTRRWARGRAGGRRCAASDDLRDPVREVGGGAVPVKRNGIADGDHAAPLVPEPELELREVRPARDLVEARIQLGVLEEPGPRALVQAPVVASCRPGRSASVCAVNRMSGPPGAVCQNVHR